MRILIASVALALALAPSEARAKCVPPTDTLFPRGGVLPPNPTLYLFTIPSYRDAAPAETPDLVAESEGRRLPVELQLVSEFEGRRVFRVKIEVDNGPLSILYSGYDEPTTYTVGVVEPATTAPAPTILSVGGHESRETCATTNIVKVHTSIAAAAFEGRFSDGTVVILPPRGRLYGPRHTSLPRPAGVDIGNVGCLGHNIPRARMSERLDLQLTALMPDGSRWPLGNIRSLVQRWPADHERIPWWLPFALLVLAVATRSVARTALHSLVLAESRRTEGIGSRSALPAARVVRR